MIAYEYKTKRRSGQSEHSETPTSGTATKQEINERRKKMKDKRFLLCFGALAVLVSGLASARGYRDMSLDQPDREKK